MTIAFSCSSTPQTPDDAPDSSVAPVVVTVPVEAVAVEEVEPVAEDPIQVATQPAEPVETVPFDPKSVSIELKETTFFDVKALIGKLNKIIQAKDYEAWAAELTQGYRDYYSSPATLATISDAAVLKRQKIVLNSLKDYFIHVVYPSRQNDRVDDIEFIDETRIRAIIVNVKGERLVLYNLEKIDDTWKIAIWR